MATSLGEMMLILKLQRRSRVDDVGHDHWLSVGYPPHAPSSQLLVEV